MPTELRHRDEEQAFRDDRAEQLRERDRHREPRRRFRRAPRDLAGRHAFQIRALESAESEGGNLNDSDIRATVARNEILKERWP